MKNSERRRSKDSRLDYLLKVLDCLGKLLQISLAGLSLLKRLGA